MVDILKKNTNDGRKATNDGRKVILKILKMVLYPEKLVRKTSSVSREIKQPVFATEIKLIFFRLN